jgi:basic membrane lipoprotein Med (substrate-binding protein (PBP1-ABC) superfamily)
VLPYIHYSNDYWNTARTIWGAKEKGLTYAYSDRLQTWMGDDYDSAWKEVEEKLGKGQFNPRRIQMVLSYYHKQEVTLRHIIGQVNVSNGYNVYCYGYIVPKI